MEYLLVMSLSGSTMTGIYLLLRYLFKGKISARLYYLLAKVAVIYYLIPLPFLKGWYKGGVKPAFAWKTDVGGADTAYMDELRCPCRR